MQVLSNVYGPIKSSNITMSQVLSITGPCWLYAATIRYESLMAAYTYLERRLAQTTIEQQGTLDIDTSSE